MIGKSLLPRRLVYGVRCETFSSSSHEGPLKGVKVLDLTRILAGPSCTMTLADYGAEVYKIENVNDGDPTRNWPPFLKDSKLSTYFVSLNRNKKSVCINFKHAEGQELLKTLARKCDVMVENYVPGVLKNYRLDYDSMAVVAPHLIYCSITGFGSVGPYATRRGVDLIAASYTSFLDLTGPLNGEPCHTAISPIDVMTGLHAEGAILAALFQRCQTGRGQKIDANLFATGVWSLNSIALNYLNLGIRATRMGTEHESVVPYKSFRTADDYFTVGAINDEQFRVFCKIVSLPQVSVDARFDTCAKRATNRSELYAILEPVFAAKSTVDWCRLFEGSSIPHAPLNSISDLFDDQHLKKANLVKEIDYPDIGAVKVVDAAVKFGDNFTCDMRPAPALGQHTEDVLKAELNCSEGELAQLRKANVIR